MKIGVYGLGRFGSFWAESLSGTGNEVIAYSRSKHTPPKGVRIAGEEEVLNSDLLFFSVAISSFEDVLVKVGKKIGKNTIAMDTCSVKKYPIEWMENNIPGDIYTIGTHPMFGPDSGKNGLMGLPVVMCPMKEIDNRYKKVKDLFLSMGLKVIEMTGDEHDRDAAFSQGVTHFIGRVLKEMNLEEKEIATKGYISLLEIVEQTCHDPLQLFYDLQRYNPYTRDMRHALRIALENVGYRLENGEKGMNVYVYTLGCRLNQCESEAIADSFTKNGFDVVKDYEDAEIIVVNTRTVTSKAEQKARRMIRLFSERAKVVIATGCYAEVNREEVEGLGDNIVIFSLGEKASILTLPEHIERMTLSGMETIDAVKSFKKSERSPFSFDAHSFSYHSRAYLKIQDGCDNSCGYCRTTIARGKSVFLEPHTVVERVKRLEEEGFHEIMLTGVNLTNYDHQGEGLGGVMEKILSNVGPDIRLRLSSMEPDHVDGRLLDAISDYRVFPHFHIPIQSASDHVLKIVGRKYSISHVEYIIKRLREIKDDPFIACDVIAGLPGEREEDWRRTYDFLSQNDFAAMHVFPYSSRPGTPLYNTKLRVEERVRDERALELRKLSERQSREYLVRQEGKTVEIIAEKNGEGTTGNYLKAKIIAPSGLPVKEGGLYKGIIKSIFPLEVYVG